MAFSKTFLLLGLAFAVVLLISSEVSARELAETTQSQNNVEESNYGDHYGFGHGKGHGHGGYGHGGYGHGGYGHGKGHGGYGHGKGHGHGGPGHHGKPGHGGHPASETQEVETQGGEN